MAAPYRLALVMAGGGSAGAFSAGAIDFLVEALAAWSAAKANGTAELTHEVEITALSGASAGAVVAALTLVRWGRGRPEDAVSPAYRGFVEQSGLLDMLGVRDRSDPKAPLMSLLDASAIDDVSRAALRFDLPQPDRPPYVRDGVVLATTSSNLTGIPYAIGLGGVGETGFDMALHADTTGFSLCWQADAPAWTYRLPATDPSDPNWSTLTVAAAASGAVPFLLRPRGLERPRAQIGARPWPDLDGGTVAVPPAWRPGTPERRRDVHVDGGLLDNQPFELARRQLDWDTRPAAAKGLILIEPFPTVSPDDDTVPRVPEDTPLTGLLPTVLRALLENNRFRRDELIRATVGDGIGRHVIAPRLIVEGQTYDPALAGQALDGLGGFIARDFREFDYRLGRRNAQKFLRDRFTLPADHPLFADLPPQARERNRIEDENGVPSLPIVPLVGAAAQEEPLPDLALRRADRVAWPDLQRAAKTRARAIGHALTAQHRGWLGLAGWALRLAPGLFAAKFIREIEGRVRAEQPRPVDVHR